MGQNQSVRAKPQQRYEARSISKAPTKITITKPKVAEGHAVLQVPHTNVKIMHVDEPERAGIVPTHGYIALQIVPPEERDEASLRDVYDGGSDEAEADSSRKKKRDRTGQSASTSATTRRRVSLKQNMFGVAGDSSAFVAFGEDAEQQELAALLEKAAREYNAEEHRVAARDVKRWKAQFVLENGHAPSKKDISANPYIFQQYYREKELAAMQKLIAENDAAERAAAVVPSEQPQLLQDLTELQVARSEFNAMELLDMQRDIKRWKVDFKKTNGRPPTKRDISEDPDMFAKYYRVKELEAMKKLIEDADAAEAAAASGADTMDPIENAKAQFDADEYTQLSAEVHQWKKAFRTEKGRPPTKRDIAEDPEMFTKYYREKELEAMKKLIEDSENSVRRASVIDAQETIIRAHQEYNAEEHESLTTEVRAWKLTFKQTNGRPPTKRDIAEDPDMFAKYYREKELDAMKKLLEEEQQVLGTDASATGADTELDGEGRGRRGWRRLSALGKLKKARRESDGSAPPPLMSFEGATDSLAQAGVREGGGSDFPQPTPGEEMLMFSVGSGLQGMAATTHPPAPGDSLAHGDAQPHYKSQAPPALTGFAAVPTDELTAKSGAAPTDGNMYDSEEASAVVTQFVFPKGHQAAQRVFFFDAALQMDEKAKAILAAQDDLYDPVANENKYDLEEDEIYEMAGMHRPRDVVHFDEDADPLATYEVQSNVLEALRMAIDAPIQDFYQTASTEYDDEMRNFMEDAILEARDLFEKQANLDAAYQRTYSVAQMAHTKSRTGVGMRMMSKVKSRVMSQHSIGHFSSPEGGAASPQLEEDEFAGMTQEELVKERKKLHKLLNKYKHEFVEKQGRPPEAFEMAQDPSIRDVFAQYHTIKKRTKIEAVIDAAMASPTGDGRSEAQTTDESPQALAPEEAHLETQKSSAGFNPFAKVLAEREESRGHAEPYHPPEDMVRRVVNNTTLLAPIDADAAPQTAEERELDILSKEVNLWKKGFTQREGRNPTRRDIKADEEFSVKYFRVKELEELLGKPSKKKKSSSAHRNEEDDGGNTEHSDAPQHFDHHAVAAEGADSSYSAVGVNETYQLGDDEDTNQSNYSTRVVHSSPQVSPRKKSHAHRPTEEELAAAMVQLVEDEDINRRDIEADEDIAHRFLRSEHATFAPPVSIMAKKTSTVSSILKKEESTVGALVDTIRSAVLDPIDAKRPTPPPSSIELYDAPRPTFVEAPEETPHIKPALAGWSFPVEDESGADAAAGAADASEAAEPETIEDKKARRKEVSKELNQWKAHFKMVHSKAPTAKDIKGQPQIQKLFDEYQQLTQEITDAEKKAQLKSVPSTKSFKRPDSRNDEDENAAPIDVIKKRRAQLAKDILEWRTEFKVREGHVPALKDIAADETVSEMFAEYTKLNDQIAREEGGAQVAGDNNEMVALALRRKQLGRNLNEWKANFFETYGRNPNVRDIKTDKAAALMYEEYNLIPKNVEDDATTHLANAENEIKNSEEMQWTEARIRKKELNKILNEWKAQFQQQNERKPKVSDMLADPIVSAVYAEFQELQAALKAAEEHQQQQEHQPQQVNQAPGHAADAEPQQTNPPPHEESPRPETPLAKRKKRATKELNHWKAEFKEREGRNPTKADIKKDAHAFDLFQEYQRLKELLSTQEGGEQHDDEKEEGDTGGGASTVDRQPPEGSAPIDGAGATDDVGGFFTRASPANRKTSPQAADRDDLRVWDETVGDEAAQQQSSDRPNRTESVTPEKVTATDEGYPHAAGLVETTLDNHQSPEPGGDDSPQQLKDRKRLLNKRLNAWKVQFSAVNGRNPKQLDIQQDPDMLLLYEELKEVKKALKAAGATEGDGGADEA